MNCPAEVHFFIKEHENYGGVFYHHHIHHPQYPDCIVIEENKSIETLVRSTDSQSAQTSIHQPLVIIFTTIIIIIMIANAANFWQNEDFFVVISVKILCFFMAIYSVICFGNFQHYTLFLESNMTEKNETGILSLCRWSDQEKALYVIQGSLTISQFQPYYSQNSFPVFYDVRTIMFYIREVSGWLKMVQHGLKTCLKIYCLLKSTDIRGHSAF